MNEPLVNVLDLEQSSEIFRDFSLSERGDQLWGIRLSSRFPGAQEFIGWDRSNRDFYIALAEIFQRIGFDPQVSVDSSTYEDAFGKLRYQIPLNKFDVITYVIDRLIQAMPKNYDNYRNIARIYVMFAELKPYIVKWLYVKYQIPADHFVKYIDSSNINKITPSNLEYLVSIVSDRNVLKNDIGDFIKERYNYIKRSNGKLSSGPNDQYLMSLI